MRNAPIGMPAAQLSGRHTALCVPRKQRRYALGLIARPTARG